MGGGGGQPGWIAQRTQDTGCRTHGTHETHEIRSYGNVPARISKKKHLGMQDCQDREKTIDRRWGLHSERKNTAGRRFTQSGHTYNTSRKCIL